MKSEIITFKNDNNRIKLILQEVEKAAKYNGLQGKAILHLRLLAEEVCCMVDVLVKDFDGEFWLENTDGDYSLCLSLNTDSMNVDLKEKLLATSTSGKNASAKGFVGWIRNVVENFAMMSDGGRMVDMYGYGDGLTSMMYSSAWYYSKYKVDLKNSAQTENWDELEKSILAKLADEVIVGIKGTKIEVIVKKNFK